jgi:hypothetical protein
MPSNWGRYSKPVANVRSRLLKRCKQEDRGHDTLCLIWYGEKDKEGYGRIKSNGKYVPTHWVLDGKPPEGLEKDHLCHVRDCVRPSHLENVTRQVNTDRRRGTGRQRRSTEEERSVARQMLGEGQSLAAVAAATGLSRRTVGRIRDE